MNIVTSVTAAIEAVNRATAVLARVAAALTSIADRKCATCKGSGKLPDMKPSRHGEHQVGESKCYACKGRGC